MHLRYLIPPIIILAILFSIGKYVMQIVRTNDYSLFKLPLVDFVLIIIPLAFIIVIYIFVPIIEFIYKHW